MTTITPNFDFSKNRERIRQEIRDRGNVEVEEFLTANNSSTQELIYAGIYLSETGLAHWYPGIDGVSDNFYYFQENDLDKVFELIKFSQSYYGPPLPPDFSDRDIYNEDEEDDLEEVNEETLRYHAEFAEFKRKQAAGELLSQPQPHTAQTSQPVNRLDDHTSHPDNEYTFSQLLPVAAFCLPLGLGSLPLLTRGGDDAIWAAVMAAFFLYSPIRYLVRKESSSVGGRIIPLLMSAAMFWICLFAIAKIGGDSSSTCWYIAGCI